ncbi:MAG: ABC transporter permease/substrate-binding protein [Bacteroidales bacterium]
MKIFPEIFNTIVDRREYLYELLIQHIVLSAGAIAIILVIGLGTGILILHRSKLRQSILGVVNFLYTIPSIAMFGLFIPLVGIGYLNALVVLIIYGLLPMIRNTYTGLSEVDPHLLDAAKGMGATPGQVFLRVRWPLALPTILSGFRTMVVMTIALAGLASFIGAGGLGQAIYRGINTNNSSLIIAGSVSVALLALIADWIIGFFENSLKRNARMISVKRRVVKYFILFMLAGLLILMIIPEPGRYSGNEIVVATKPTAEQYILGEIISQLIENHTDMGVRRRFGIGGGTSNIHPAILAGEVDVYPEYTGTAWLFVLKEPQIDDPDSLYNELRTAYAEKYNLEWTGRVGFNNTFTLALPEKMAQKENIRTFSDLASVSNSYIFGAEFDFFEREDGFEGLAREYNFNFRRYVELDINLKFQALANQTVDVINAFSTDSRIREMNLRVLKDDRLFFPSYQAGIVVRNEILNKYPDLKGLFQRLNGTINDSVMLELNYEVEILKRSPDAVAYEFLSERKLLQ